jgi:hypothetical protein
MASKKTSKSPKARAAKTSRKQTPAAKSSGKSSAASRKVSALDAAARVLEEAQEPLSCPELIRQMADKGYWTSPAGKTPASTLYAALQREIKTKKEQARFQKTGPGKFARA